MTNHDVKAIEYVLKRRLQGNAELAKVCFCTGLCDFGQAFARAACAYLS